MDSKGSSDLGFLRDVWPIITSFACADAQVRLCRVSKSMNALVWSTKKQLRFWGQETPERFSEYIKKAPNLEILYCVHRNLPANPQELVALLPKLQEFYPGGHHQGEATRFYWCNFKNLKKLNPASSPYQHLFPKGTGVYPTVTHIEVEGPQEWGNRTEDSDFLLHFPNLIHLQLRLYSSPAFRCDLIPDSTCANLKTIHLTGYYSDTIPLTCFETLSRCQNLTYLKLESCQSGERNEGYSSISALKNLEILDIAKVDIPSSVMKDWGTSLPKLRVFDVWLVNYQFEALEDLTQLEKLGSESSGTSKTHGLKTLEHHTKLTELILRDTTGIYGHNVSRLTDLERLDLWGCMIQDDGIFFAQGLVNLRTLNVASCGLTSRGWGYLTGLTNLTDLNLAHSKVDDWDLRRLKSFPFLERVSFCTCPLITGKGFDQITNLVNLEFLDLSETSLKNKYFKHLTKFPNLTELNVSGTPLTDHAMTFLKDMKSLILIWAQWCPNIINKPIVHEWTALAYQ